MRIFFFLIVVLTICNHSLSAQNPDLEICQNTMPSLVTEDDGIQKFWYICEIDYYTAFRIDYYVDEQLCQDFFWLQDDVILHAEEQQHYMPIGEEKITTWTCTYNYDEGEIVDVYSLGIGPDNHEDFDYDGLSNRIEAYKKYLVQE